MKENKDRQQPTFISIATQKGGVGKSTLTAVVASILHYRLGYNVVVADVDYPQHSISNMRKSDLDVVMKEKRLENLVKFQMKSGRSSYPVLSCPADEIMDELQKFDLDNIDVVLFDMPGTINQPGVIELLSSIHHIFIPLVPDLMVMRSAMAYAITINDYLLLDEENCKIEDVHCFWTRVDGRTPNTFFDHYFEKAQERLPALQLMETTIPNSLRFNKEMSWAEIVRSTVLPPSPATASTLHISTFTKELIEICKL